ncbi:MAG TPA: hypothetical protein DCX92_13020 [Bacteroidetes bacterium]|nr:hypothetical protein [Bacteroidota bacterium]
MHSNEKALYFHSDGAIAESLFEENLRGHNPYSVTLSESGWSIDLVNALQRKALYFHSDGAIAESFFEENLRGEKRLRGKLIFSFYTPRLAKASHPSREGNLFKSIHFEFWHSALLLVPRLCLVASCFTLDL